MYSLLKNYKNLENHKINGKIVAIERLKERAVLLQFFPKLSEETCLVNNCPISQQHLSLKHFLTENLISEILLLEKKALFFNDETIKESSLAENPFLLVGEEVQLNLNNNEICFDKDLWQTVLRKNLIQKQFKIFKKCFYFLEKEFRYNYLVSKRKLFFNRNINNFLFNLNAGKSLLKTFYKNFIHKIFWRLLFTKYKVKKNVLLPLPLWNANFGGLVFKIPNFFESFFTPYGFLQLKKKSFYSTEDLQNFFQKKSLQIFYFKIKYVQRNQNSGRLSFILEPKLNWRSKQKLNENSFGKKRQTTFIKKKIGYKF